MRLKFVLLLVVCCMVVIAHGKKGKGKKNKNHETADVEIASAERNPDRSERPGKADRKGGKKGKGRHDRPEETSEEGEVDALPPGCPTAIDTFSSKESGGRSKKGRHGRHRLVKEDPRRYSSQQNGPMPPSRETERPARIQQQPDEGDVHALEIESAPSQTGRNRAAGGTQNRLSEEEEGIFLQAHNQFRSDARPYAANMVVLQWDVNLANMAQGWADQCTFAHGNPENISPFSYVGQNIWAGSGPTSNWNHYEMVKSWDDEKEYYDYNSDTCTGVCGHYTQLVWAETTHVGCALATCAPLRGLGWSPATILVCNYGEGGNYIGQKPYISGQPCSQCPSGYDTCTRTQLCTPSSQSDDSSSGLPDPVNPPEGGGNPSPTESNGNQEQAQDGEMEQPSEPSCGGTVRAASGEITSPNFPSPYENNVNCEWVIQSTGNARISLQFMFMDIESASQCPWDYLVVTAEDLNPIRYCGSVPPAPVQSSSNEVRVQFWSDDSVTRGGFKIRYTIQAEEQEQEDDTCGGVIRGSKGTISSPGYPEHYPHNLDCMWTLKVSKKKRVRITFRALDIEDHETCNYDSLSIRLGTEKVPMSLCGSEFLRGKPYLSLGNEMQLHFRTDNQGSAGGFSIQWKAV